MADYIALIAASTGFVGSHFAMSHPLRAPMVKALGAGGFMAAYTLISFATFIPMVMAFRAAPVEPAWWDGGNAVWALATLLTLLAAVLLVGSFLGNPALPAPGADLIASQPPKGVFRVTRHPMMWGFAIWGVAHLIVAPRTGTFIFIGALIVLALGGAWGQDSKKAALMGEAWRGWVSRTSFVPNLAALAGAGLVPWVGGSALWLLASYMHPALGGPVAGVFRWAY